MDLEQRCQSFFHEYQLKFINDKKFLENDLKRIHYLDSNLYRMTTDELASQADYVTKKIIETFTENELLIWSKNHHKNVFQTISPNINSTSIANLAALYLATKDKEWKEKLLETRNKCIKIFLKNRQFTECVIC